MRLTASGVRVICAWLIASSSWSGGSKPVQAFSRSPRLHRIRRQTLRDEPVRVSSRRSISVRSPRKAFIVQTWVRPFPASACLRRVRPASAPFSERLLERSRSFVQFTLELKPSLLGRLQFFADGSEFFVEPERIGWLGGIHERFIQGATLVIQFLDGPLEI